MLRHDYKVGKSSTKTFWTNFFFEAPSPAVAPQARYQPKKGIVFSLDITVLSNKKRCLPVFG